MGNEKKLLEEMLVRHPELECLQEKIEEAVSIIIESYENKGTLLTCGNGGSEADSDHIVGELMKGFYKKRKLEGEEAVLYGELAENLQGALPAIALTQHSALISAFANDVDPDMVYAQQVYGYGKKGDVLIGITTSGNSRNVCLAAEVAKKKGLKVIGFTGEKGGRLKELCDVCINVPEQVTAFVQEKHIIVYHTICAMIEEHFYSE